MNDGVEGRTEGKKLGSKYNNGDVLGKVMIVGRERIGICLKGI